MPACHELFGEGQISVSLVSASRARPRTWAAWWRIYALRVAWYPMLLALAVAAPGQLLEPVLSYLGGLISLRVLGWLGVNPLHDLELGDDEPVTRTVVVLLASFGLIALGIVVAGQCLRSPTVFSTGAVVVLAVVGSGLRLREAHGRYLLRLQDSRSGGGTGEDDASAGSSR